LGYRAGHDVTEGTTNTLLGYNTGRGITTGDKNTIVGANVTGLAADLSNNIILADGDGNQRIRVNSSGNVGIGTTSPYKTLQLQSSDEDMLLLRRPTTANLQGTGILFGVGDTGVAADTFQKAGVFFQRDDSVFGGVTAGYAKGKLIFAVDNTADSSNATLSDAKMVIQPDGNVGIGATSPSTKLHIGAGAMTLEAMTAPSSPASDKAALYVEASGESPSRTVALKVKWQDGSSTTIASVTV
jgi:hypothetical protein